MTTKVPVELFDAGAGFTIGSGAAEDTKIVFDGNAQDFYVALDDSADDLIIGLGSTVGTTPIMSFDENKDVTINEGKLTTSGANGADNQGLNITDTGYSKTHKIYGDNSLHIQADSGQQILFKPNATEAARFDASGNFGIGSTTAKKLVVNQTGTSGYFLSGEASGTEIAYWYYDANQVQFASKRSNSYMAFLTEDTERMRIGTNGNVSIGYAGSVTRFYAYGNAAAEYIGYFQHDGNDNDRYGVRIVTGSDSATTGQYWMRFDDGDGHAQAYIYHDSGSVVIHQASDERLKENIVDSTLEGINTLKSIKQREFNWKRDADKEKVIGYIAQELESVYPAAVLTNGDKSGQGTTAPEDDPDNPYKYLAKEKLIDVLIKATQEQQVIIDDLKSRIETLEGS